jgi:hypothetical protein
VFSVYTRYRRGYHRAQHLMTGGAGVGALAV